MKTILIALAVWAVVDVLFLVWWARLSRPDPIAGAMDSTEVDNGRDAHLPSGGLLARALHLESRGNPSPSWLKGPRRRGVPSKMLKLGWLSRRRNRPAEEAGSDE
jgi:hypothetical protein